MSGSKWWSTLATSEKCSYCWPRLTLLDYLFGVLWVACHDSDELKRKIDECVFMTV